MPRLSILALAPFALLALAGCPTAKTGDDTAPIDTDVTDDSNPVVDDTAACTTAMTEVEPADGTADVYYRGTITVSFDGDGGSASFHLVDSTGTDVPFTTTYTDGNVQAVLTPDDALTPLTDYLLDTVICGVTTTTHFTTSELGTPLASDVSSLLGSTYMFRLSDSDITEPAFLDLISGTYLTVPILLGVDTVDATSIHMIGGLGDESGTEIKQSNLPTWDFPEADFTTQPYFHATSPLITIMYGDVPIPISDFNISGTFTPDGTSIQEGYATGTGDSRYMAELVGKPADDYSAVCDLAASMGVVCTACSDGEPYCLYIVAENITATKVDGMTLTVIEATP